MGLRTTCITVAVLALCVSSASGLRLFQLSPGGGAQQAGGVASAALLGAGGSGSALIGPAGSLSTIKPAKAGTAAGANANNGGSSSSTGVTIGGVIGNKGKNNGTRKGSRKNMKPKTVWHKRLGVLPDYDVPASDCKGTSPCKVCKPLDKVRRQCAHINSCKSVQWNRKEQCGVLKTINTGLAFVMQPDPTWVVFSMA